LIRIFAQRHCCSYPELSPIPTVHRYEIIFTQIDEVVMKTKLSNINQHIGVKAPMIRKPFANRLVPIFHYQEYDMVDQLLTSGILMICQIEENSRE